MNVSMHLIRMNVAMTKLYIISLSFTDPIKSLIATNHQQGSSSSQVDLLNSKEGYACLYLVSLIMVAMMSNMSISFHKKLRILASTEGFIKLSVFEYQSF